MKVPGAVFGAVLITVLSNAMNLVGVSYYLSLIIKGAVIIAFIAVEGRNDPLGPRFRHECFKGPERR